MVTIEVNAAADVPVADDDSYSTDEDTPLTSWPRPACLATTPTGTATRLEAVA